MKYNLYILLFLLVSNPAVSEIIETQENEISSPNVKTMAGATAHKNDVKKLQQMLKNIGYNPGPIDGIYGKKTKQAYEAYKQIRTKLHQFYRYDNKRECWILREDSETHYCMKITKSNIIHTKSGKRNYLLLTGIAIDSNSGEEHFSFAVNGNVSLFIIEGTKILAVEPKIPSGAWGQPLKEWNLIKLAPSDYWGWQNESLLCHHGYCRNFYVLFAPYGKIGIKKLVTIITPLDYTGVGIPTEVTAKIKIDNSQVGKRVFPLKVKIKGKVNGKKLKVKTWELPFDTKKWQYIEPKNWPFESISNLGISQELIIGKYSTVSESEWNYQIFLKKSGQYELYYSRDIDSGCDKLVESEWVSCGVWKITGNIISITNTKGETTMLQYLKQHSFEEFGSLGYSQGLIGLSKDLKDISFWKFPEDN